MTFWFLMEPADFVRARSTSLCGVAGQTALYSFHINGYRRRPFQDLVHVANAAIARFICLGPMMAPWQVRSL